MSKSHSLDNHPEIEQLYQQLKQLARSLMKKEREGHTISPTDLVHSAYEKLANSAAAFNDEKHYFQTMAKQMKRLLIDYARQKNSRKRDGSLRNVTLTDSLGISQGQANFLLINEALESLNQTDSRCAQVVEWAYFTPLEQQKIAEMLSVSISTVERDLKFGRAFISNYISQTEL